MDTHNLAHVARHGNSRSEAEDVLSRYHVLLEDDMVGNEKRWVAVGSTRAGRILVIVFTVRGQAMRPITGWNADKEAAALYFKELGAL